MRRRVEGGERERERERVQKKKKQKKTSEINTSRGPSAGAAGAVDARGKKINGRALFCSSRERARAASPAGPRRARGLRGLAAFLLQKPSFPPRIHLSPPPPSRFRRSFEREDSPARLSSLSSLLSLSFSAPRPLQQRPDSLASFRSLRARSASSRDQRENSNQDRIPFDMSDVGGR